jgi:hypothetical protein
MPVNHVLLETIELNQSSASITFDNIPQTGYTDLIIKFSSRDTSASAWNNLNITFNGSGTYYSKSLVGTGSGVVSQASSTALDRQYTNSNTTTANIFGNGEIYIPNYAGGGRKVITSNTVGENNGSTSIIGQMAGMYTSTTAITQITLTPNSSSFLPYSTFSLYGIATTGTSPAIGPKAQGGNIIANDGTYWYHAFTSSGTFTPAFALTSDVLVIAGGGSGAAGGNSGGAGGGGAGGLLYFSSQSVSSATNVVVGAGGAAVSTTGGSAFNGITGSDSQFGALTLVKGGGYGGGGRLNDLTYSIGGTGGSGGGAGRWSDSGTVNGGSATSGQGNAGGNSSTTGGGRGSGGGGGAGAAGTNGVNTTNNDGAGGTGVNTYSTWATATSTGVSGYYAGGGGGSSVYTSNGTGGAGGGGAGGTAATSSAQSGTSGTYATGGGGGGMGGGDAAVLKTSGAGGSGIVIIRYTM